MCVRIYSEQKLLIRWSEQQSGWIETLDWEDEVFPGRKGPILVDEGSAGRLLVGANWGFTPRWSKDVNWGKKNAVNARSETAFEKPTWKGAIRNRRCIVPVTSFYERISGRWIQFAGTDGILSIAGLYEPSNDLCLSRSFALLTTDPNEQIAEVQDRMPVLLAPEDVDLWLDASTPENVLKSLLRPCPEDWTVASDAGPIRMPSLATPSLFEE